MCFGTSNENDKVTKQLWGEHLGIIIDNELKFDPHIRSMCKRAVQKLGVLTEYPHYQTLKIRRLVFNAAIKSHFNYCPLIWMFGSRRSNNLTKFTKAL